MSSPQAIRGAPRRRGAAGWAPYRRGKTPDQPALPADYREILAIVRAADGPVPIRAAGVELGLQTAVRGKPEPLRTKTARPADRAWLHKRPDGKFTAHS